MVKICCIDGCNEYNNPDIELRFFKFPKSRTAKQKWLKAIQTNGKIHSNSLVCSSHFLDTDYQLVHGRKTLKTTVVPTVFHGDDVNNASKPPDTPKRSSPRKRSSKTDIEEKSDSNETLKTSSTATDMNNDVSGNIDSIMQDKLSETTALESNLETNGIVVNNDEKMEVNPPKPAEDISSTKETSNSDPVNPDPLSSLNGDLDKDNVEKSPVQTEIANQESILDSVQPESTHDILTKDPPAVNQSLLDNSNPDYEELIKETHVRTADLKVASVVEAVVDKNDVISVESVDTYENKVQEPVFISIPVNSVPGSGYSPQRSPDCMMVMESLQVELDPACLFQTDDETAECPAPDDDDDDDVMLLEKPNDPVSLLTSSDDDDVIIEEPKIDTVEVSDETDEDDLPLTRYLKTKKGLAEFEKNLKDLFWGTAKEYYCYSCSFTSKSKADLTVHMESHAKTSQIYVCPVCSFQSASKGQFARHKRKHKEEKRYKCHICDYRARHKMSLVYHVKMHTNKDKNVYHKCKLCEFKTDNRLQMHKHLQSKHKVKIYVCSLCNYSTKRQHDLKKHTKVRHSQRPGSDDEYVPDKAD